MSNRASQEDRAQDCQEIQELRKVCSAETDRARQWKVDELSIYQKETFYRESALGSDSGLAGQAELLE